MPQGTAKINEYGPTRSCDEVFEIPGLGMVACEVRTEPIRTTHAAPMLGPWTYPVEKIETRLQLDEDPFTIK